MIFIYLFPLLLPLLLPLLSLLPLLPLLPLLAAAPARLIFSWSGGVVGVYLSYQKTNNAFVLACGSRLHVTQQQL